MVALCAPPLDTGEILFPAKIRAVHIEHARRGPGMPRAAGLIWPRREAPYCSRPLSPQTQLPLGSSGRIIRSSRIFPAVLLRQHLTQIGNIGCRLVGRQVSLRDAFSFGESALQADDQGQILPDVGIEA